MSNQMSGGGTRPKAATAIGIINIIFSGLGIIGGFISLGMFSMMKAFVTRLGSDFGYEYGMMMSTFSAFFTIIMVITVVQFIIRIAGLVSGIGLLKEKYWSINLANIYAGATIILLIANFIATRQIISGIFDNPMIMGSVPPEEQFALDIVKTVIPTIAGTFSIIFGSAYPVLVLVLLNRAKVREFYLSLKENGEE